MSEKIEISLNKLIVIFTKFNKDNNLEKYMNTYNISKDMEISVPLAKLEENHRKINTLYDKNDKNTVDIIRNKICEIQIRIIINKIIGKNNICDKYVKAIQESIINILDTKESIASIILDNKKSKNLI